MKNEKGDMQLTVPLGDKLDEQLAQLCSGHYSSQGRVAILVRCDSDAIADVAESVEALGGTIRHRLNRIGAIAAWLPLTAVEPVARHAKVSRLDLEQSFTIA
jgi:hypothetical protein